MSKDCRTETTAERDGLHCVYGTCRGLPCHAGCSFTMRHRDWLDWHMPLDATARLEEMRERERFEATMTALRDWLWNRFCEAVRTT